MNVVAYVNGKRVTKEEISRVEIQKESAKRVFLEVLAKRRKANGQRDFI